MRNCNVIKYNPVTGALTLISLQMSCFVRKWEYSQPLEVGEWVAGGLFGFVYLQKQPERMSASENGQRSIDDRMAKVKAREEWMATRFSGDLNFAKDKRSLGRCLACFWPG